MRKDLERSQPERRSVQLAKTRRRINISDQLGSSRIARTHCISGSEEEQVVVGQVNVVVTPNLDRPDPVESEEEVTMVGKRVEEEVDWEEVDNMPSTTRLKYSQFKGNGSQDVDN